MGVIGASTVHGVIDGESRFWMKDAAFVVAGDTVDAISALPNCNELALALPAALPLQLLLLLLLPLPLPLPLRAWWRVASKPWRWACLHATTLPRLDPGRADESSATSKAAPAVHRDSANCTARSGEDIRRGENVMACCSFGRPQTHMLKRSAAKSRR